MPLYSNGFPIGYQPVQQFNPPANVQTSQMQPNNIVVVYAQGEEAVKNYPIQTGKIFWILDTESPYLYVRVLDSSGFPAPIRKFRLSEETNNANETGTNVRQESETYVTRAELEKLLRKYQRKSRRRPGPKEDEDE